VTVRKIAEREEQLGRSHVADSQSVSYEPKQGASFLVTQPVEGSLDDARVQDRVARWRT
jgi:hypothetical protein